jgi:hypothetical protein
MIHDGKCYQNHLLAISAKVFKREVTAVDPMKPSGG